MGDSEGLLWLEPSDWAVVGGVAGGGAGSDPTGLFTSVRIRLQCKMGSHWKIWAETCHCLTWVSQKSLQRLCREYTLHGQREQVSLNRGRLIETRGERETLAVIQR